MQEACLKAFRAFDRFERGTDYKRWLFRILINSVLDWRRRAARDAGHRSPEGVDVVLETPLDPELSFLARAVACEVEAAITALSPEWHEVIYLSFVEGLSYREIAETLGCRIGTVMSRLYRARQTLRRRLAPVLGDPEASAPRGAAAIQSIDMLRARLKDRPRLRDVR